MFSSPEDVRSEVSLKHTQVITGSGPEVTSLDAGCLSMQHSISEAKALKPETWPETTGEAERTGPHHRFFIYDHASRIRSQKTGSEEDAFG